MSDARNDAAPRAIFLKDYRAPEFLIDTVDLNFDLGEERTRVRAQLQMRRVSTTAADAPLVLSGHGFELESVTLDGRTLQGADYVVEADSLTLAKVPPESFLLDIVTVLRPQDNTSLEGLYKSSGNFCTQCEAQGFRKITYFLDRPDVLARYTVTLRGEQARYPVLLSNGNCVARGEEPEGMHWARWQDPFPKPCYLFAMVAGDLACVEDQFITRSGRRVVLQVFVQHHNAAQCRHALRSLQKAMRWDEETFGREYDLDIYMIVAVDDFNMGAMENKGLNIFNSRYVLAKPQSATDADYQAIESIIGHEYFHNWSGNRVTCRDWFQLSLKEGFTVFRDQEFSADMSSRAVKRIADVNALRTNQFREDAGPMAHPVRPESYVEINNFYTMTVYNKGAELIRMMRAIIGERKFRAGTDVYFARHDGQAVTTDDFVRALEDASGVDLAQFKRWYSQAGTPELHIERHYDAVALSYTLTVRQSCPATPGQPEKQPFHIPFALGLLDAGGQDSPLQLAGEAEPAGTMRVLQLRNPVERYTFVNIPHEPVPSLLRGFSAPVKIHIDLSEAERCFLMANDSDLFNRWEASQQLAVQTILKLVDCLQKERTLELNAAYVDAVRRMLENTHLDPALIAQALSLPAETYIAEFMPVVDPDAIHSACRFVRRTLAVELRESWQQVFAANRDSGEYSIDAAAMARRALKNMALGYLMELDDTGIRHACVEQFRSGNNMTDVLAALVLLINSEAAEGDAALAEFYAQWRDDNLVLDKWFAVQSASRRPDTLQRVIALTRHSAFNIKNPNRVRSVIGSFAHGNHVRFHQPDGAGYALVGDYVIKLNSLNPQVAARLVSAFTAWRRYDHQRQVLMKQQLERLRDHDGLCKDVFEIVGKSLA